MRKLDQSIDQILSVIAHRTSGRALVVLVVLVYGGIGLALPLVMGWPIQWLVSLNIMGTALALSFTLVWFAGQVQARDRRHLVEWTTDLRLLDSEEFEWFVGELFRREGWVVEETGSRERPDGNIDLSLKRDGQRRVVQCKRWSSWLVGVDEVRAFAGTLMREGLTGRDGVFVTLSGFTEQARDEAKRIGLLLVDNRDLYVRAEAVRRPEPCPQCAAAMVLDRSPRGWWFRCVSKGCTGKRDLTGDPARAVELLTEVR